MILFTLTPGHVFIALEREEVGEGEKRENTLMGCLPTRDQPCNPSVYQTALQLNCTGQGSLAFTEGNLPRSEVEGTDF